MFNFGLPIVMEIRQARRMEISVIVVLFLQQNIGNEKTANFQGLWCQKGAMLRWGFVQVLFFCKQQQTKMLWHNWLSCFPFVYFCVASYWFSFHCVIILTDNFQIKLDSNTATHTTTPSNLCAHFNILTCSLSSFKTKTLIHILWILLTSSFCMFIGDHNRENTSHRTLSVNERRRGV